MPNKRSKSEKSRKEKMVSKWKNPTKSNASSNPNRIAPGKEGANSNYRSKVFE